ncbi:hypothetical protein F994_02389 [Acinetobacter bohemicus ANC 3994]|uniref:Uncharacterized protein n=1 Tax=Acinetobacter bohemicus ANC 3994 TaxID=1217715 RepID=N8QDZ7_9GAMM|nr:hypothetical protein F994_02389 [Acinetobacter bohemicus ANC 3994]
MLYIKATLALQLLHFCIRCDLNDSSIAKNASYIRLGAKAS